MDFFKIFIKRILYKIPLKLLLLIVIVLFLSIICFNAKCFAYTTTPQTFNNIETEFYIPDNVMEIVQQAPQYNNPNYNFLFLSANTGSNTKYFDCMFIDSDVDLKLYNNFKYDKSFNTTSRDGNNSDIMRCDQTFTAINYHIEFWYSTGEITSTSTGTKSFSNNLRYWNLLTLAENSLDGVNRIWYLTSYPVYTDNTFTTTFAVGQSLPVDYVYPYFVTSASDIENWSFDNLVINLGDEPGEWVDEGIIYQPNYWSLDITYNGIAYPVYLSDYFTIYNTSTGGSVISIPRDVLTNRVVVRNGQNIDFQLRHQLNITGHVDFDNFVLGDYTLTLTTEQEEEINQDSDKQLMYNIDNSIQNFNNTQQQTNNKIDNLTDSITDDNVDDMTEDFTNLSSGFEIEDPSGLEEIFQILYDSFCTDEVINLSFTIPFVNKNVTISSENISSYFPQSVKSVVSIFVWGMVGLWVLKDIRSIVNKIAEGSAEDVGSDVKKEVL